MDQDLTFWNSLIDLLHPTHHILMLQRTKSNILTFAGAMRPQIRYQNIKAKIMIEQTRKCRFPFGVTGVAMHPDHSFIGCSGIE